VKKVQLPGPTISSCNSTGHLFFEKITPLLSGVYSVLNEVNKKKLIDIGFCWVVSPLVLKGIGMDLSK